MSLLKIIIPVSILTAGTGLYFYTRKSPNYDSVPHGRNILPEDGGIPRPHNPNDPDPYMPSDIEDQLKRKPSSGYLNDIADTVGFSWLWSKMPQFVHQADTAITGWVDGIISGAGDAVESGAEWVADKGADFLGGYFSEFLSPQMIMWIVFGIVSFIGAYITFRML